MSKLASHFGVIKARVGHSFYGVVSLRHFRSTSLLKIETKNGNMPIKISYFDNNAIRGRFANRSISTSVNLLEKNNRPSDPPEEEDEESRARAKTQEMKIRTYKKVFSLILFSGTFILVFLARKLKRDKLHEFTEDCHFIPIDDKITGSYKRFLKCSKRNIDPLSGKESVTECVLPAGIVEDGTIKRIAEFQFNQDDVIVASFPKTGTTWVQEIVYLIKNGLNVEDASKNNLEDRFPYLEYPYPGINSIEKMKGPRFIKTHLPYTFLPKSVKRAKIIYITRNPKDTVVSYFHFSRMLKFSSYTGSFDEFQEAFKKNQIPYTPFFGHITSYESRKDDRNILFITYEELSKDPFETIRKISTFLEIPLSSEDVNLLVAHTSFQNMSKNKSCNYEHWDELGIRNKSEEKFMRKGKVGSWREYFTSRVNQDFDDWMDVNNPGYTFLYD